MKKDNISIPLEELLWLVIGDRTSGISCGFVPKNTALILDLKLKGSNEYIVETHGLDGEELPMPRLWHKEDYRTARTTYQKQKKYANDRREKDWIYNSNHRLIIKAIEKQCPGIAISASSHIATTILKAKEPLLILEQLYGIKELILKVEDINNE